MCPQLPPSMHRKEWCLNDYIITDKLYKGYASMGEPGQQVASCIPDQGRKCCHAVSSGFAHCCATDVQAICRYTLFKSACVVWTVITLDFLTNTASCGVSCSHVWCSTTNL